MANQKLTFLLDVVSGKATADLEKFSTKAQMEAAKAQGGFQALGSSAKANMGPLLTAAAVAGGTAIAAFATKAVGEFQNVALAAGKMSDATGLAIEDASRWREVASDLGVSADAVGSSINSMNRAASAGDLAALGITTKDVNEQFIAVLQYLKAIPDANRRAAEGTRLLGKGWTELAPLVEKVAELRDRLRDVSEQKVIDEGERKKAEQFRDSMDNLRDSLDNIALAVGESLVPALSDLADAADPAVRALNAMSDAADKIPGPLGYVLEGMRWFGPAGLVVKAAGDAVDLFAGSADEATGSVQSLRAAGVESIDVLDDMADSSDGAADALKALERANKDATKALEDMVEAQGNLARDTLDVRSAQRDLAQANDDLATAQRGTTDTTKAETAALNDLADAQANVARATQRIVDARERLAQSQADDARAIERARIALANAKRDLEDAGNSNTSNGFKDAQDRVRLAQLDLDSAMERQTVNARDGAQAVTEAEEDKAKAIRDAAEKQAENAQKIADAQTKSAEATKTAAERQRELEEMIDAVTAATLRLREAEEKLRTDRLKASGNPTGALSPQLAASVASAPPEPAVTITNYNEFNEIMDTGRVAAELDRILGRSIVSGFAAVGVGAPTISGSTNVAFTGSKLGVRSAAYAGVGG